MQESPNQMTISDPSDNPITDSFGNAWRITPSGHASANGVLDHDTNDVLQLAYANQMVWRQTSDLLWRSKRHPSDPWMPHEGTHRSPLSGPLNRALDQIQTGVAEVLMAVGCLRADFDAYKANHQPTTDLTPVLNAIAALKVDVDASAADAAKQTAAMVAAISSLNADLDATEAFLAAKMEANRTDILAVLNQILDEVKSSTKPTRLVLDVEHSTHTRQAIPLPNGP